MNLEELRGMNYYEVLGVEKEATAGEIKSAYIRAITKYHPDINPGEENKEIMNLCRTAYNTLKDEELRRAYDESLVEEVTEDKDYYAILGVPFTADEEEIEEAFRAAIVTSELDGMSADELRDIKEAYEVLSDEERRAEYDESMGFYEVEPEELEDEELEDELEDEEAISDLEVHAGKSWFQKHKGKLITTGLVIASLVVGSLLGAHFNKRDAQPTDVTTTIESPEVTETPEEEEKITAENIDVKVNDIVAENKTKGFSIDPEMVKAALLITNVDHMDPQDIYDIFAYQLDGIENSETRMMIISEEIQKMYDYVSAVRTHNNNGGEYISMVNLAYDQEDSAVLQELDTEYRDLAADLKSGEITSEEYQASFKYVTEFYTGKGYLTTSGSEYSNYSMTAGGGLLSEAYWPMFAVAYRSSELETKENAIDIKTLSEGTKDSDAIVNGSKYLGSIVGAINNCENYITIDEPGTEAEHTKTLTN